MRVAVPLAMRDEAGRARCAFCTFLVMNESYLPGALTLAHGLRSQRSAADLVCLVTPEIGGSAREALEILYDRVIEVPSIRLLHKRAQTRQHVSYVFTRLHALRLSGHGALGRGYERVVLLDADVLPIRRFDSLFALRPPAGIPNERKGHFVELDASGRQVGPSGEDPEAGWVWHRIYGGLCRHGEPIPRAITDRVLEDPSNLGVNGSVILVEPSEREFDGIMRDLERAETRRLVTDVWDWPDQQYLTARWSGTWSCIDVRFSGLCGYPSMGALYGTHFAGVKPWQFRREAVRRFARYDDFRHWFRSFAAMVLEDFPRLQKIPRIRTILGHVRELLANEGSGTGGEEVASHGEPRDHRLRYDGRGHRGRAPGRGLEDKAPRLRQAGGPQGRGGAAGDRSRRKH